MIGAGASEPPTRRLVIVAAVFACAAAIFAILVPSLSQPALIVNTAVSLALIPIAGRDLRRRGWRFGYVAGALFLLPLLGLIVYACLTAAAPRRADAAYGGRVTSPPGGPR